MYDDFQSRGFCVAGSVFSEEECRAVLPPLKDASLGSPVAWHKGWAAVEPSFAEIARDERILDPVTTILGPDVILWGAKLLSRPPGYTHPWHDDPESSISDGFVSAWIGLADTCPATSLNAIAGSHHFPDTIKGLAYRNGTPRHDLTDETVLDWARAYEADAAIEKMSTGNGDLLLFDGRLWHGSSNDSSSLWRMAVLLQYARPDRPIRVPKTTYTPIRPGMAAQQPGFQELPRPPCMVVAGHSPLGINEMVPPPAMRTEPGAVHRSAPIAVVSLSPRPDPDGRAAPLPGGLLVDRTTAEVASLTARLHSIRGSVAGTPPQKEGTETLLIGIDGSEIDVFSEAGGDEDRDMPPLGRLDTGDVAFLPGHIKHDLAACDEETATVLSLSWRGNAPATTGSRPPEPMFRTPYGQAGDTGPDMELSTDCLKALRIRRITLGAPLASKVFAHDTVVILVSGRMETGDQTVEGPAMLIFPAGVPLDLKPAAQTPTPFATQSTPPPEALMIELEGRHRAQTKVSPRSAGQQIEMALTLPLRIVRRVKSSARRTLQRWHLARAPKKMA